MGLRSAVQLARESVGAWSADGGTRMGAALAYYTFFSLAPLVIVATAVAGLVFGEQAAGGEVFRQMRGVIGPEAAGAVEALVTRAHRPAAGGVAALVGLLTMMLGASAVVGELQASLNHIWKSTRPRGLRAAVQRRLLCIAIVLGVGFILLVSLGLSAGVHAAMKFFDDVVALPDVAVRVANETAAWVTVTLLFAALFKWLPDADVRWREVWLGATLTSAAFIVGKYLLAMYLGRRTVTPYGAAGSLVLVLLWVYYSSQIFYLGAEFTRVYALRRGPAPAGESQRVYPHWLQERRRGPDRRLTPR
ncbi:MAG: YihY/virulence factor BrkB family protein [Elusimicrobia bacterium]|nr:YihY/virulence factor BrkB family protein [Elusimicrobiota bacterium]